MPDDVKQATDRRTFVKQVAGTAFIVGMDARSYGRVLGSNDRIRLAQLGCGGRSHGHIHMVQMASKQIAVECVAVCDIWTLARERRAAQVQKAFNSQPKTFKYSEDMLELKDIDGVMIATGDFQHAKLCTEVVHAGKDCYVEKPFANVLSEAKEARDAVKASKQMVQMGSQHRSEPYQLAENCLDQRLDARRRLDRHRRTGRCWRWCHEGRRHGHDQVLRHQCGTQERLQVGGSFVCRPGQQGA